ncbi:MAG: hypothetical protein EKK46_03910 [Rhodocyclaceae bacterium]|nr:MAG: hypothetical protein EKK46_03910 [Rhodocyclaceae bacterium]
MAAQILGGLLVASLLLLLPWRPPIPLPLAAALAQGLAAALAARWLRAPSWWQGIHLLFMPLVVLVNGLHLPPILWLGGFLILLLVYWRTDLSRVPLYLSNRPTAAVLASLIPAESGFVVDLGCGTGGLLVNLSSSRPDCHFTGIEHAPIPFLLAWLRCRRLKNVDIRYGDFWALNLHPCQLVYAFLSPVPMPRLWEKARAEMSADALLVSNSFAIPDVMPEQVVAVGDARDTQLYCYRPGQADRAVTE